MLMNLFRLALILSPVFVAAIPVIIVLIKKHKIKKAKAKEEPKTADLTDDQNIIPPNGQDNAKVAVKVETENKETTAANNKDKLGNEVGADIFSKKNNNNNNNNNSGPELGK